MIVLKSLINTEMTLNTIVMCKKFIYAYHSEHHVINELLDARKSSTNSQIFPLIILHKVDTWVWPYYVHIPFKKLVSRI